jgi:predicted ribosomally synthesized peptide with nif11-like leader
MKEKLEQLMKKLDGNNELIKKLFAQETPEGAQAVLKENGFDFTTDEIKHVGKLIIQAQENTGEELSDDALENVAGGGAINDLQNWWNDDPVCQYIRQTMVETVNLFKGW